MLPMGEDYEAGVDTLERLAPTLTALDPRRRDKHRQRIRRGHHDDR